MSWRLSNCRGPQATTMSPVTKSGPMGCLVPQGHHLIQMARCVSGDPSSCVVLLSKSCLLAQPCAAGRVVCSSFFSSLMLPDMCGCRIAGSTQLYQGSALHQLANSAAMRAHLAVLLQVHQQVRPLYHTGPGGTVAAASRRGTF
jgi:hypothetical protein